MARWRISGTLFMGGCTTEADTLDCGLVVNLCGGQCWPRPNMMYLTWHIVDGPLPDLILLYNTAELAANAVRRNVPTLVHCAAGLNRSALVASLAHKLLVGCSGAEAMALVRARREDPNCLSNQIFADWLRSLP
jgi:hypothetical protein